MFCALLMTIMSIHELVTTQLKTLCIQNIIHHSDGRSYYSRTCHDTLIKANRDSAVQCCQYQTMSKLVCPLTNIVESKLSLLIFVKCSDNCSSRLTLAHVTRLTLRITADRRMPSKYPAKLL